MRRVLKALLLFLIFHLDVSLKAAPVFLPESCWKQKGLCVLKTEQPSTLSWEDHQFHLKKGSFIKREEDESFKLLEGEIAVETGATEVLFHLPNGKITGKSHSKFRIDRSASGVGIEVLEGEILIEPLGLNQVLSLPGAYRSFIGWVGKEGVATSGFPRSLSISRFTQLFQIFYGHLSGEELKVELQKSVKNWQTRVEQGSRHFQETAEREIAMAREKESKARAVRARQAKENAELRELFRKKNFLDN